MDPFEALVLFTAVVSVFIVMPLIIANAVKSRSSSKSGELRKSELEAIITSAVAEATAPLARRIETLEAIAADGDLDGPLQGRLDPSLLADPAHDGPGAAPSERRRSHA